MLYRIAWTELNKHSGHGDYCFTLEAGQNWIRYLRKEYPDMNHWLEPCVQIVD